MSMIEGVLAGMSMRTKQQTDAEDREALRKKRKEDDEDRAFTMSERARSVKMRQDMGNAAAEVMPVEVKEVRPDTMDNRDVGQAGEAPLPTAGYDVGGKRFTDAAAAKTAATAQNTPQAVTARMSDVLMRNGDPVGAQKLRTGAMEEQAGQYKLNDAMRADLRNKWNDEVQSKVVSIPSLEAFLNDTAADGNGGKIKGKMVPTADGKAFVWNVAGPDGTLHPTEKVIQNTPDGLLLAKTELARIPEEKILAHLHQKAMLARQVDKDAADAAFRGEELGLRRTDMERRASHERRMEGLAASRAAAGSTPAPTWDDKADAFLRERYTSKSPDTGAVTVDGRGLQFGKLVALAEAQRNGGDTTTALGAAFQRDAKLRDAATVKGVYDPAKHDELREKALAKMFAKPGDEAAPAKEAAPKPEKEPDPIKPKAEEAAPPVRKSAPPGSMQAKWDARQAELKADQAKQAARKEAASKELSTVFQADAAKLSPLELVQKYDEQRGKLSVADAAALLSAERSIR